MAGTPGQAGQGAEAWARSQLARVGCTAALGQRVGSLSVVQRQLLEVAKSLAADPSVLILDEPTASLDAVAEAEVFKNFAELMGGRMAILISHRFSTVRMADRIVVLSNGQIEEEGSHDRLIAVGGQYARLFEMQAAKYR